MTLLGVAYFVYTYFGRGVLCTVLSFWSNKVSRQNWAFRIEIRKFQILEKRRNRKRQELKINFDRKFQGNPIFPWNFRFFRPSKISKSWVPVGTVPGTGYGQNFQRCRPLVPTKVHLFVKAYNHFIFWHKSLIKKNSRKKNKCQQKR